MFKKILLFVISFFCITSFSHAEMIDYLDGSMRFSQGMVVTFSGTGGNSLGGQANYYTGFVNTMTGKILYIKSVDCKVQNQNTSSGTLQWGFELSPNSSYTSKLLHAGDTQGTGTINYKSFVVNQIFTGSLYYRISEIKTYTSLLRSDNNFLCYINGTYFSDYLKLSSNSSTGSITINDSNIVNQLSFQNDLLIFTIGFFIMFFAFILSFVCYSKFSKTLFFNKPSVGKKP